MKKTSAIKKHKKGHPLWHKIVAMVTLGVGVLSLISDYSFIISAEPALATLIMKPESRKISTKRISRTEYQIDYEYTVNYLHYVGSDRVGRLPSSKTFTIYYNRNNPKKSKGELPDTTGGWFFLVTGLCFCFLVYDPLKLFKNIDFSD